MGLKNKLATKMVEKNLDKLAGAKDVLAKAAVNDDDVYEGIANQLRNIESGRRRARKYYYKLEMIPAGR